MTREQSHAAPWVVELPEGLVERLLISVLAWVAGLQAIAVVIVRPR